MHAGSRCPGRTRNVVQVDRLACAAPEVPPMRVLKTLVAIPVCALFFGLAAAPACADPITVTAGNAIALGFGDLSSATLVGERLRISGDGAGEHSGPDF